jgi:LysM repeat protein
MKEPRCIPSGFFHRTMEEHRSPQPSQTEDRAEQQGRARSMTIGYAILGVLWLIALVILWPTVVARPEPESTIVTHAAVESTADVFATMQAQSSALPTPTLLPSPSPTPALILRSPHVVEPGDTLQAIALQYNSSVALLAIEVTAEQFTPGKVIQVPVPNPAACPSGRIHVVEQNETLFGLSRLYDTSVEALMSANNLAGNLIHVGDVLCLPLP